MRLVIICLVFLMASCAGSVPKGIVPIGKMQKVLSEIMQVEEFVNIFVIKDSTVNIKEKRSQLYEQTFKLNGITRKQFYSSLKYYQQDPSLQKTLFDSAYNELNRKKADSPKVKT